MYTNKFKKGISILLAFALILGMSVVSPYFGEKVYADEDVDNVEETVIEVSTWDEFKSAFKHAEYQGKHYTIRLMEDLSIDAVDKNPRATTMVAVYVKGNHVTLDFNGHTLSCNDNMTAVENEYALSDFITIYVIAEDGGKGSTLRFTDSSAEGNGGIYMYSKRTYDTEIAALNVIATDYYFMNFAYGREKVYSLKLDNQVYFDGGNYKLECVTQKAGKGTVSDDNNYRSCVVISGFNKAVVNDGKFTAIGSGNDSCTRELTAFGVYTDPKYNGNLLKKDNITINGGWFYSDGYSLHSFGKRGQDGFAKINEYMTLNGGFFQGPISFVGGFYKDDGGSTTYSNEPASTIIKNKACGINGNGKIYLSTDGFTLEDLHKVKSCYVFGPELLKFNTTPAIDSDEETIKRSTLQTETFTIEYKVPAWWDRSDVLASPYFVVASTSGQSKTYEGTTLDVNYADYPNGVTIMACLSFDPMSSIEGQAQVFSNTYIVEIHDEQRAAEITTQPVSVTCEPGETVTVSVAADYGKSYEWYVKFGDKYEKISAILSVFGQLNGVEMIDYQTPNLKFGMDGIDKAYVYCEVTGTDGTKVKSDYVTITFGASPKVHYFTGGTYYEGQNATYYLKTKYIEDREDVTFIVYDKKASSSAQKFYTLEEFTEATGIKATAKVSVKSQFATVIFENVPSNLSSNYAVGYQLSNTLGQNNNTNPETMLYFEKIVVYPEIITDVADASCYSGDTLEYTVEADEATSMEWRFETIEDETVVVYSADEMRAKFPNAEFKVEQQGNKLMLTIEHAEPALNTFGVYAHIVGKGASISSNIAKIKVREVEGFQLTGHLQGLASYDGTIEILLTDKDAGGSAYKGKVDVAGNYVIVGVPAGKYALMVKADGYTPYIGDVNFVSEDVVLDVVMEVITHKCTLSLKKGKDATCTSAGKQTYYKCGECGKCYADAAGEALISDLSTWGIISAKGHTEVTVPGKAATCTETGMTDGTKCSVCGEEIEAQQEIPVQSHTEEVVPGKVATCTEPGLTDGKKCSVCGNETVAQTIIQAKHTVVTVSGKEATCTEPGLSDGKKCSICGVEIEAQIVVPVKPHIEEVIPGKTATCTETGLTDGKKCSICGTVIVEQIVTDKEHVYKTIITKATTSKDGKIVKKCECGDVQSTTTIKKVSKISLSKTTATYTGKTQKSPTITVKDSAGKTIAKTNYTISKPSKSLKNVGKYTYTIKFKGNYSGTKKLSFTITPKATSVKKLTAAKKAFTVKLSKVSAQATGYEIMYATNSKFTKGKKTVKITSYKTTSKKISKLSAKKTYYVRVRTYKTVNGTKIYSKWSKVSKIKTL